MIRDLSTNYLFTPEDGAIEVKLGSPIQSPKPDPADTPVLRNKLKRSPLTDDEKLSEATFSVPEEKKKKGMIHVILFKLLMKHFSQARPRFSLLQTSSLLCHVISIGLKLTSFLH